ncbi:hypothetical protein MCEMKE27_01275 [Candidatus Nanopelagicaceae bacterium]
MLTMSSTNRARKATTIVLALVFGFVSLGFSPAYAIDERVIDVVEVTWAGAAAPAGNAAAVAKVIDTEVNADWKKFTTLVGDTKDRVVSFTTGKVLNEPISLTGKMACTGSAASDFMSSIRPEAYKRLGITDSTERYLVVVAPKAGCIWSGRALVGNVKSKRGTLILHDTASSFVITHELGHNFGLGHSNFLRCDSGANDGPWSDTCKAVEYGGTIDVMGNVETSSPLSTYHQWRMGLLEDSQIKQVWLSEVVNLAPSDFANGTRAIYMRDGKAAYWIEYRRKTDGVQYKPGLVIFRLDPPPINAIVSPNPEDSAAGEFGEGLGADVWMLNLDNYVYRDSRQVGGSMTGLTATTYSGNISFSAVPSDTGAVVTITRKADVTAPAVPPLVDVSGWRFPAMEILKPGYEDAETAIKGFEAQIDGVVKELVVTEPENWWPTYLNPFAPRKTVFLKDLPEGSYNFALRAVDIAGNKSPWTPTVKVTVDRGEPIVDPQFSLTSVGANEVSLAWDGLKDPGSGLCQTNLVDEDGLILQSSKAKSSPVFKVQQGVTLTSKAQAFDCIGNGIVGDLTLSNSLVRADKSSKTGKWSPAGSSYPAGSIRCVGKCTLSMSASGSVDVLVGTGSATVSVSNSKIATIVDSKVAKMRVGARVEIGATKRVIRLTGSNFVAVGANTATATFRNEKKLARTPAPVDESLEDSKQLALSKFGFNANDFSQEWNVLPMPRGTTLDDPTLDLCNGNFSSEKGRAERRQLNVFKQNSPFAFLSTEVVRYTSAAAASAAHAELAKVFAQCQIDKGYKDATGALNPYEFYSIKNIPAGLVPESQRVLVNATIGTGIDARQLIGFYQFNGDLFTGLYVLTASQSKYSDAQVAKWLKVAVTMSQRLQGKSA